MKRAGSRGFYSSCPAIRVKILSCFLLDKWCEASGIETTHSNSIVAGGFPVQSYKTRLT